MKRRTLLHVATAALPTVLAGCGTDSNDSTSTPTANRTATETQTPAGTGTPDASSAVVTPIQELWTAYNDENATGVTAAYHPDAPSPPQEAYITFQGEVTIEDTTVTEQTADEATVVGNFTLDGDDTTETQEHTYELRQHDGEWLIYTVEMGTADSSDSEIPQISFSFEYDSAATDSADSGVVTVTHSGGDNVDGERLSVRGDGIVLPADAQPDVVVSGTTWAQAAGTGDVQAGDEITVGVSSDCNLSVVWESESSGSSAVLASYTGPDA